MVFALPDPLISSHTPVEREEECQKQGISVNSIILLTKRELKCRENFSRGWGGVHIAFLRILMSSVISEAPESDLTRAPTGLECGHDPRTAQIPTCRWAGTGDLCSKFAGVLLSEPSNSGLCMVRLGLGGFDDLISAFQGFDTTLQSLIYAILRLHFSSMDLQTV